MIEAFPLYWPHGFERTPAAEKQYSQFKCTVAMARDGVLKMYGNMRPVDGDTGVAVYFTWDNDQYVLACDQYISLQDNLRAIEKSIDAIRGLRRWGASDILKRAFQGFMALPASKQWFEILELSPSATYNDIQSAYKRLAKKYHPDNAQTGDHEKFIEIKNAYDQAMSL